MPRCANVPELGLAVAGDLSLVRLVYGLLELRWWEVLRS